MCFAIAFAPKLICSLTRLIMTSMCPIVESLAFSPPVDFPMLDRTDVYQDVEGKEKCGREAAIHAHGREAFADLQIAFSSFLWP